MTGLDWLLLVIVALSAVIGLFRGLIAIVVSLVAWLLAGLAAWLFGGELGRSLFGDGTLDAGAPGWGEYLGGYAIAFGVVWIAVALLGWMLRRLAHSAGLSGIDRLSGFGLGVVRGVFLACVLLLMLGLTTVPTQPAWRESAGVAVLRPAAEWMRAALPVWMRGRVDLEGRGASLQDDVQAGAASIRDTLPAALPEALPLPLPVQDAPEHDETSPASTRGSAPDGARID